MRGNWIGQLSYRWRGISLSSTLLVHLVLRLLDSSQFLTEPTDEAPIAVIVSCFQRWWRVPSVSGRARRRRTRDRRKHAEKGLELGINGNRTTAIVTPELEACGRQVSFFSFDKEGRDREFQCVGEGSSLFDLSSFSSASFIIDCGLVGAWHLRKLKGPSQQRWTADLQRSLRNLGCCMKMKGIGKSPVGSFQMKSGDEKEEYLMWGSGIKDLWIIHMWLVGLDRQGKKSPRKTFFFYREQIFWLQVGHYARTLED